MLSCEICEISKNAFFIEYLVTTAYYAYVTIIIYIYSTYYPCKKRWYENQSLIRISITDKKKLKWIFQTKELQTCLNLIINELACFPTRSVNVIL